MVTIAHKASSIYADCSCSGADFYLLQFHRIAMIEEVVLLRADSRLSSHKVGDYFFVVFKEPRQFPFCVEVSENTGKRPQTLRDDTCQNLNPKPSSHVKGTPVHLSPTIKSHS